MDTRASHHISQDLQQLTLANSYPGADQVVVGDGTCLKITHTGNSIIHTPVKPLYLKQVLCVPKTSLIYYLFQNYVNLILVLLNFFHTICCQGLEFGSGSTLRSS